jgi:hypothetical protein
MRPTDKTTTSRFVQRWRHSTLLGVLGSCRRVARNVARRLQKRADYPRWTSADGLQHWWDERTQLIATMVPPGTRVIEFGCGRRVLERHLPRGCTYVPSDIVERGPDTVVCDLNASRLPDLRHLGLQVAVFSGVLEYIADVGAVARWLSGLGVETCIASYDAWPAGLGLVASFQERARRAQNGYMSSLAEEGLLRCFTAARMRCVEARRWTHQGIYVFVSEAQTDRVGGDDGANGSPSV